MQRDLENVLREALELSDSDRATLAGLLIESLQREADRDVLEAWSVEIGRRLSDLDSGTVETVPWEDVRRRMLDRLSLR